MFPVVLSELNTFDSDMSALRFAESFVRAIHSQKARGVKDTSHSMIIITPSVFQPLDSVTCVCAAAFVWENRFQIVCRRHIDLFTSE